MPGFCLEFLKIRKKNFGLQDLARSALKMLSCFLCIYVIILEIHIISKYEILGESNVKCWNSSTYLKVDMEMTCYKYLSFIRHCVCVCVLMTKRTDLNFWPVWCSPKHTMNIFINIRWKHSHLWSKNSDRRAQRKILF